jgi:hypothetical protein
MSKVCRVGRRVAVSSPIAPGGVDRAGCRRTLMGGDTACHLRELDREALASGCW